MTADNLPALVGPLRWPTFSKAILWLLQKRPSIMIETGCYRGIDADGMSTVVLGKVAKDIGAMLYSFELNPDHLAKARSIVRDYGLTSNVIFIEGDSITELGRFGGGVQFAYLDSLDHDEKNPEPSQQHQLRELQALIPKLHYPAAILMDDNISATGGKPKLAAAALDGMCWVKSAEGYQLLYTQELK